MNSLDAEFGVNRGRRFDVEVSWPASGIVDWVRDVLAPAIVTVTEGSTPVEETLPSKTLLPSKFALHNAFPNPLYRNTKIRYNVPAVSWVTLKIYSVNGQLVRTLVNREVKAGYQRCSWDGKGAAGESVASGIYFYRLSACPLRGSNAADFSSTRKLVVLR